MRFKVEVFIIKSYIGCWINTFKFTDFFFFQMKRNIALNTDHDQLLYQSSYLPLRK